MKTFLLIICLCAARVHGQTQHAIFVQPAYSTLSYRQHIPALSFSANQAAMARVTQPIAGVYGEQRYMLQELGVYSAAAIVPTRKGVFGGSVFYSGSQAYHTQGLGVAYAHSLGKTHAGIQFHYIGNKVGGYENNAVMGAEVALQYEVSQQFIIGFQVSHEGMFSMGKPTRTTPLYRMGGGYQVSEDCFIGVEMIRNNLQSAYMQSVLHYSFMNAFHAWAGYSSGNGSASGGAGYTKGKLRVDVNVSYHPFLGITPGVGISKVMKP
ncbi:MAG: hypothetical protein KF880_06140 [Ferruginibacter sp.]|nr:hypothetical protein [Ferruginibacter sp.]